MPKKTKKQKLLADIHKKAQFSIAPQTQDLKLDSGFVKSQYNNLSKNQTVTYSTDLKYQNNPVVKAKSVKMDSSYAYVRNDLIRITIFTAFALALQGVLYFLIRTR